MRFQHISEATGSHYQQTRGLAPLLFPNVTYDPY